MKGPVEKRPRRSVSLPYQQFGVVYRRPYRLSPSSTELTFPLQVFRIVRRWKNGLRCGGKELDDSANRISHNYESLFISCFVRALFGNSRPEEFEESMVHAVRSQNESIHMNGSISNSSIQIPICFSIFILKTIVALIEPSLGENVQFLIIFQKTRTSPWSHELQNFWNGHAVLEISNNPQTWRFFIFSAFSIISCIPG